MKEGIKESEYSEPQCTGIVSRSFRGTTFCLKRGSLLRSTAT